MTTKKTASTEKKKKIVSFRFTPEFANKIELAASVSGQTQTDFVVDAINAALTKPLIAQMNTLKQFRSKKKAPTEAGA